MKILSYGVQSFNLFHFIVVNRIQMLPCCLQLTSNKTEIVHYVICARHIVIPKPVVSWCLYRGLEQPLLLNCRGLELSLSLNCRHQHNGDHGLTALRLQGSIFPHLVVANPIIGLLGQSRMTNFRQIIGSCATIFTLGHSRMTNFKQMPYSSNFRDNRRVVKPNYSIKCFQLKWNKQTD